jgi:hypothetical protein
MYVSSRIKPRRRRMRAPLVGGLLTAEVTKG